MNPWLSLLALIEQPFREAQVDRLDGSVMECVNCGSVKTGGCGRMERFQKSSRCVTEEEFFFSFFYNPVSSEDRGSCFFFFSGSEKDLRRQITQIAFEQVAV